MSAPKDRPLSSERERFLNLRHLPAQLNPSEAAWCLGFAPHDIPVLISQGLLKPLGHPADNAVKYFALATVEELKADVKWNARARQAIYDHWRTKNAGRSVASENWAEGEPVAASERMV